MTFPARKNAFSPAAAALLLAAASPGASATEIYTSTNGTAGNAVLKFEQSADGALTLLDSYTTGGLGTGGGLGNQGAIVADDDFMYVVNAGSNDISVFRFDGDALTLMDRISSAGVRPVSVAIDRGILYVVNAGSDDIAGFTVSSSGELAPIAGSRQPLSQPGSGPAQIGFSKDGRNLVVTEKATNRVLTYPVDRNGVAGPAKVFDSPGATPFGFSVTAGRRVLVSEAAGGAPGASSVTSWKLAPGGELQVLDAVAPTRQSAACWVTVTPDGRFAYTTNTASGTISAYRVRGDDLLLRNADGIAASTGAGSAPIDVAITPDGRFLHVLNSGADTLASFRIANDGSLTAISLNNTPPDGANGLLAR